MGKTDKFKERNTASYKRELKGVALRQGKKEPLIVKQYTKVNFPPNSEFTHPKHIAPDVVWSSMHIQGKQCVIGYFEDNIFHVVFLDKSHEFWKTKKKHT